MTKRYVNGEERHHISTNMMINTYQCPDCGFEYNAQHTQDDEEGGYICPLCEVADLEDEYKKVVQKLADLDVSYLNLHRDWRKEKADRIRMEKALKQIAEIDDHDISSGYEMKEIALNVLGLER